MTEEQKNDIPAITENQNSGTAPQAPPARPRNGCMPPLLGCSGLFFLFILSAVASDFFHVIVMVLLGIFLWWLVAKILGRRLMDPVLGSLGIPFCLGLLVLGVMMPFVSWMPCPSWVWREVVKPVDYRAMAVIFNQPLPASFRITRVYYPGVNLQFNGPDGPEPAEYEVVLTAADYAHLKSGAKFEEIKSQYGEWPSNRSRSLMEHFGNDWPKQYEQAIKNNQQPVPPRVFGVAQRATVTVDDRLSSTTRLYICTRVPYGM